MPEAKSTMEDIILHSITKLMLIEEHLDESTRRLDRLIDVEKKLSSVNPSQYLSELQWKLERNLKQKDQSLECRIGPASKLKKVILAGLQTHDQLQFFINNDEKATDCLKKKLSDYKLKMEKEKKYISLIQQLL